MTLAWAPAGRVESGQLPATLLITNPRDSDDPSVLVEGRIGVPPIATETQVSVAAGRRATVPFSLPLSSVSPGRNTIRFAFAASGRGHRVLLDEGCNFWLIRRANWDDARDWPPTEISLLPGPEVLLGHAATDWVSLEGHAWAGPEDLSVRFRVAWAPAHLIVSAVVRDDVHVQHQAPEDMWRSDSLQLAFDYRCAAWRAMAAGRPARWLEIGVALGEGGQAVGYQWFPNRGPLDGIRFSVSRRGKETQYLVSVPAGTLGAKDLAPGDVIGFAALVNDDDGLGRKGWLALDDGIGFSKDPRKYGLIVLD